MAVFQQPHRASLPSPLQLGPQYLEIIPVARHDQGGGLEGRADIDRIPLHQFETDLTVQGQIDLFVKGGRHGNGDIRVVGNHDGAVRQRVGTDGGNHDDSSSVGG